jgi:hypothetical protein
MSILPRREYGLNRRDGCELSKPPARSVKPKQSPYDDLPRCQRCWKPTPHCECDDGPLRAPEHDPACEAD